VPAAIAPAGAAAELLSRCGWIAMEYAKNGGMTWPMKQQSFIAKSHVGLKTKDNAIIAIVI